MAAQLAIYIGYVAVAMITPGPVVITVGFIGRIAGRLFGCAGNFSALLSVYDITGAIAGAVLVLAKRQFTDITSVIIAPGTILILLNFKKVSELLIIALAAAAGLLIKFIPDLINV